MEKTPATVYPSHITNLESAIAAEIDGLYIGGTPAPVYTSDTTDLLPERVGLEYKNYEVFADGDDSGDTDEIHPFFLEYEGEVGSSPVEEGDISGDYDSSSFSDEDDQFEAEFKAHKRNYYMDKLEYSEVDW